MLDTLANIKTALMVTGTADDAWSRPPESARADSGALAKILALTFGATGTAYPVTEIRARTPIKPGTATLGFMGDSPAGIPKHRTRRAGHFASSSARALTSFRSSRVVRGSKVNCS